MGCVVCYVWSMRTQSTSHHHTLFFFSAPTAPVAQGWDGCTDRAHPSIHRTYLKGSTSTEGQVETHTQPMEWGRIDPRMENPTHVGTILPESLLPSLQVDN